MKETDPPKRTHETGAPNEIPLDTPQPDLETIERTGTTPEDQLWTERLVRNWRRPEGGYYRFHNRHGE